MATVVVAFDSFKGSLPAREACRAAARGITAAAPGTTVRLRPLADGGDGTADVLREALGGEWRDAEVTHPLGDRIVTARWLSIPDAPPGGPDAVVEMAAASGLALVPPDRRDPMVTTTAGTGELIRAAAEAGARRVWLTLGGSSTVDGGTGAATAMGWRFLDDDGRPVPPGGAGLRSIVRIEPPSRPLGATVTALCDVTNPLLGPRGAARIFGPQKGAGPAAVEGLDEGLTHLAALIREQLGMEVADRVGAGAAGGLGAGAMAFLGASLEPGVERVLEAVGFDDALRGADWVLTGEGRLDGQSLDGKVVSGVLERGRRAGVPVAAVAGRVALGAHEVAGAGLRWAGAAAPPEMSEGEAFARAAELLEAAAARFTTDCIVGRDG